MLHVLKSIILRPRHDGVPSFKELTRQRIVSEYTFFESLSIYERSSSSIIPPSCLAVALTQVSWTLPGVRRLEAITHKWTSPVGQRATFRGPHAIELANFALTRLAPLERAHFCDETPALDPTPWLQTAKHALLGLKAVEAQTESALHRCVMNTPPGAGAIPFHMRLPCGERYCEHQGLVPTWWRSGVQCRYIAVDNGGISVWESEAPFYGAMRRLEPLSAAALAQWAAFHRLKVEALHSFPSALEKAIAAQPRLPDPIHNRAQELF